MADSALPDSESAMPRKQAAKKSKFGTVTKLQSGRYSGRYNDPDGNRRSLGKTYENEADAWAALAAVQTDLARGQWLDPDDGNILFRDFAEKVRGYRVDRLAPRTRQENVYLLRALLPTFGHRPLNKISPTLVAKWWAQNADHPVGRRNRYGLLSNIFKYAVKWDYIAKSPCRVDEAFADASKSRPVHTVDEFERVVRHLEPDLQRALKVLFAAHLRINEVCGLNWNDWDPKTHLLTVERQADLLHAGQTAGLKTGEDGKKALRPLQMGVDALLEHQKARSGIGAVPMFHGPRGGRLRSAYIGTQWRAACAVEGIENFHVHDLRHVSLTVIGQTTRSLATVMARGGHTTSKAALRYQAATRDADEAAVAQADELLKQRQNKN